MLIICQSHELRGWWTLGVLGIPDVVKIWRTASCGLAISFLRRADQPVLVGASRRHTGIQTPQQLAFEAWRDSIYAEVRSMLVDMHEAGGRIVRKP